MRFVAVGLLAACNQVYDIEETRLPPPPPPPVCPELGKEPPEFDLVIHQAVTTPCSRYTIGAGRALATCANFAQVSIVEGDVDGPLSPAQIEPSVNDAITSFALLAPEGDVMVIRQVLQTGSDRIYRRGDDGRWTSASTLPTLGRETLSTPSRGPNRRILAIDNPTRTLTEYVDDGNGTWAAAPTPHAYADLAVASDIHVLNLSPDGLRLVFGTITKREVYYTDRPSIDARFRPPLLVPGAPNVEDPFMTEGCERLYFSSRDLRSIFFIELAIPEA